MKQTINKYHKGVLNLAALLSVTLFFYGSITVALIWGRFLGSIFYGVMGFQRLV